MLMKLLISGAALLLFIIDANRIIKKDPIRQEWVSLLYFLFSYIIFWHVSKPPHFSSLKHLFVFLSTCGLTLLHFSVTVGNYWFVYNRWERMLVFFIIAWTGIIGIFVFYLYLVWGL